MSSFICKSIITHLLLQMVKFRCISHPHPCLLQATEPNSSHISLWKFAVHTASILGFCRAAPLLPNTQTEPERGREGCVCLEVIRRLSFTAVSLPIFLPALSIPLLEAPARSLCSKCVPDGSTTGLFSFKASTHVVSARSLAPQGPAWWPQINARDIFHHPEPVLTSTSNPGILFPSLVAHLDW